MMIQMQRYNIELRFRAGKDIPVPDTLSRKSVNDICPSLFETLDVQVNMVSSSLPVSDRKLREIKLQTEQGEQLAILKQAMLDGWPVYRKQCKPEIIDFWNYREELAVFDGLIMKGEKIVIPRSMRSNLLELGPPGFNCWFSSAPVFQWCCSTPQGSPGVGRNTFLSSPHLCFIIVFICDLFVSRDVPLMS